MKKNIYIIVTAPTDFVCSNSKDVSQIKKKLIKYMKTKKQ